MNLRTKIAGPVLGVLVLSLAACSAPTYYVVTDPGSKSTYYTQEIQRTGGAITFKDMKSHSTVTLQNSEVIAITEAQYMAQTNSAAK